jgi:hypothetical protein
MNFGGCQVSLYCDTLNVTINRGVWHQFGFNGNASGVGNGQYYQMFENATRNGRWWYWKVMVNDGYATNESNVYRFYTGFQSKLNNTGDTNISGYLLMQVQYYNESLGAWVLANDTINETTPRTITAGQALALDTILNGKAKTSDLVSLYGNGTYRLYAAFRNQNGDVLLGANGSLLEATWEFTIVS